MVRYSYVGPYMKVWMPEDPKLYTCLGCANIDCNLYGEEVSSNYCVHCGQPIVEVKVGELVEAISFNELSIEIFGSSVVFRHIKDVEFILVAPYVTERQGGKYFGYSGEIFAITDHLDKNFMYDFNREDWVKLYSALIERGIEFEQKYGILNWFE